MRLPIVAAVLAFACISVGARAQSVLYTVQDTASGTIGTQSFTNQDITVEFAGDISNIAVGSPGFYYNTPGVATIDIPSLGTFTFTDGTQFFVNQNVGAAGIGDQTIDGSILDTYNAAFSSYTGDTSIGPLSGSVFYSSAYDFNTTGGVLNFSSAGPTSTFTATAATPEPSSFALLGSGLLGVAGMFRRRRV